MFENIRRLFSLPGHRKKDAPKVMCGFILLQQMREEGTLPKHFAEAPESTGSSNVEDFLPPPDWLKIQPHVEQAPYPDPN